MICRINKMTRLVLQRIVNRTFRKPISVGYIYPTTTKLTRP